MRARGCIFRFLVLATLLAATAQLRTESALLEEAVGLSGLAMFLDSGATGMVLAVVHGDDDMVVGFGETAKGSGQEPDGKSLVRIGSISKALAGELLGGLAAEGRLNLTAPLQNYTPDAVCWGLRLPRPRARHTRICWPSASPARSAWWTPGWRRTRGNAPG